MIYFDLYELSANSDKVVRVFGSSNFIEVSRKFCELIILNEGRNYAIVNRYLKEGL